MDFFDDLDGDEDLEEVTLKRGYDVEIFDMWKTSSYVQVSEFGGNEGKEIHAIVVDVSSSDQTSDLIGYDHPLCIR
ncbi:hypothetical protein H5410_052669 [Solanum commersonii]|uniref:Uncharacterized protein n=1 Tax=Solanum commersonii TaxID=4109 RepID=A0A9J5X256_SOLCO|nr:hypothetical protein H5410_052669 [Solanum commersonii]